MGAISVAVVHEAIMDRYNASTAFPSSLTSGAGMHYGQAPKGLGYPVVVFREIDREVEHLLDGGVFSYDHNMVVVEFAAYSRDRSMAAEHDQIVNAIDEEFGCTAPALVMPGFKHIATENVSMRMGNIDSGAWASMLTYSITYDKEP